MRLAPIALLMLLAGCEAGVSLGVPCTRASQCAAPLVCRAGRCRVECREGRDCTFPLDCVLVEPTAGACALTADTGCGASCPAPLVCVDGACRQECEEAAECAVGMTCGGAGACARPTMPDAACNVLTDEGCVEGQVCSVVGTALACVASADRGEGGALAPCTRDADCAAGFVCPENAAPMTGVEGRTARLCVRVCNLAPESSCGPRSLCRDVTDRANGLALAQLPAGLGTCTEPCELGTDVGCPEGESCQVGDFDATHIETYCRPTAPMMRAFTTCAASYECAAGMQCQGGLADPDARVCRPFCDPGDPSTCPTGSTCELHATLPGDRPVHLCSTPAP